MNNKKSKSIWLKLKLAGKVIPSIYALLALINILPGIPGEFERVNMNDFTENEFVLNRITIWIFLSLLAFLVIAVIFIWLREKVGSLLLIVLGIQIPVFLMLISWYGSISMGYHFDEGYSEVTFNLLPGFLSFFLFGVPLILSSVLVLLGNKKLEKKT